LQAAILAPGATHIHKVYAYAFESLKDMLRVAASWMALPLDFFVKTMGANSFLPNLARRLPVSPDHLYVPLAVRALLLNSLTSQYAALWSQTWESGFRQESWTSPDERLSRKRFSRLAQEWSHDSSLRFPFERRQAGLEIDVVVAMGFGWSLDQLLEIYRTQFSVLRHYEADTWYDRQGQIVFTNSKGLVGVGLPRTPRKGDPTPAWNDVKDLKSGSVSKTFTDDTQPGGPRERTIVYKAPFDRCDRESDYEVAWAHFQKRFGARA
jgi:hypothetical protein